MSAKPSQETNSCWSFEKLSFEDCLLHAGRDREDAKLQRKLLWEYRSAQPGAVWRFEGTDEK